MYNIRNFTHVTGVTIDGVTCSIINSTNTSVTVLTPPGVGAKVPVQIIQYGFPFLFNVFSYAPPIITSILPLQNQWNLSNYQRLIINGSNFGYDINRIFVSLNSLDGNDNQLSVFNYTWVNNSTFSVTVNNTNSTYYNSSAYSVTVNVANQNVTYYPAVMK